MAITFTNLGASANPDINNSSDLAAYSNSSWSPPGSGLIIGCAYNRKVGVPETPTISGNSLTWVQIATFVPASDTSSRLTLVGANASGSTTGVTTVDFGGIAQLGCTTSFFSADGVDLSGGVAAAFVQSPTNQGTATSGSVTLAAAGSSDNRPISFFWHFATELTTERASWTEADDFTGSGPNRGVQTQYREDAFETTASASGWGVGVAWAGIAAEIKASGAAGTSVNPMGMMGFFGG